MDQKAPMNFKTIRYMQLTNMLEEIATTVKGMVGNDYLYFDESLQIKTNPHAYPVTLWGVSISPIDEVYVMAENEVWYHAGSSNLDYLIIPSLYQRVKTISQQYKKAV